MKIEKNILITDSGKKVTFPYEIKKCEICEKYYIILLDYATDKTQRNVYAVNSEGNIVWQIDPTQKVLPMIQEHCAYSGIYLNEENQELIAYNYCGYDCIIDIDTGIIKTTLFSK